MPFCVVSLNPAIDAEWAVEEVLWEEKNVVRSQRRWPGGKGVNVARWLRLLGADGRILIPLGGAAGREMRLGLREMGLKVRAIPLREDTRVNVVVTTARGRQMRFNPPGPRLDARERRQVFAEVRKVVRQGADLLLSGALPPGLPARTYAQLTDLAQAAGRRVFLDCDGEALVHGAKARPFLVKPNLHELERWAGRRLIAVRAAAEAARELSRETTGWVLLSLGAGGALLVHEARGFLQQARPPRVRVLNTVGAGDALLAAAAAAVGRGEEPADWLRAGVAGGTAATLVPAGQLPSLRRLQELRDRIRPRALSS